MTTVAFTAVGDGVSHAGFTVDGTGGTRTYVYASQPSAITLGNPNGVGVQFEVYNFHADGTYGGFVGNYFAGAADSVVVSWNPTDTAWGAIQINLHDPIAAAGVSYHGNLTYGPAASGYCVYGTEQNPDAQVYTIVTVALVDVIAALFGLGPLGITALDAMIGAPLLAPTCGNPPPIAPTFNPDDFILGTGIPSPSGLSKVGQLIQAGAWHFYCRCTAAPPGSPAPTPYVPPDYSGSPIGTAAQPVPVCDAEDICTSLNQLARQLNALSAQVGYLRQDVTLIQRQHVPFAYVSGATHSGLSGNGSFAVQGILGLSVSFSIVPNYLGQESTDPTTYLFLGEIGLGTVSGTQERYRLTHNPHLILGIDGSVTAVHYSLVGGVVGSIVELKREP